MNSKERILKTLSLKEPDRVPVVPFIISFAAKYSGIKFIEYCRNPVKLAESQILVAEQFGIDAVYVDSDSVIEAEALGSDAVYFEDEVPSIGDPLIKSIEDVDGLKIPDPFNDGRMPVWINAAQLLHDKVGDRYGLFTNINGPFQIAAQLRGITNIFIDMVRNQELVDRILEVTTETAIRFAKAEIESGSDAIVMGEAMASPNMLSPKQFERFVLPNIQKITTEVNIPFLLHICGDATLIIDLMVSTGTRFLEIDTPVELSRIRKKFENKVGIRGNVSTTLLLTGSAEEVENSSRVCISEAAKGGGFILGSGCELPKNTPQENLKIMVIAAKKYGRYPIS